MIHTLFVDESGDFATSRRWIVSGVLCVGKPAAAEKRLQAALEPVQRRFRIWTLADLHLTELRQQLGQGKAVEVARAVLSAAEQTGILTSMLVVENDRGEGLRDSERTYRLMLLDLLALADSALPDDRGDQRLEVIVARRQKAGTLMSTREDLLADVVERIEDAVEVGLAARGLLVRLDARHVRIWKAAGSAGLALADFVANLSFNRHHTEDANLFNALVVQDRLRLFEGFGDYAERRARIAERDGDLAVALSRWALVDDGPDSGGRRAAALVRLWRRALSHGATGPTATLDAVIERLWRAGKDPADYPGLAAALGRLESALLNAEGPPALVYRLHNVMHLVANQLGDLMAAERLIAAQASLAECVAADPSLFHLILDGQLLRILTEELRLDFDAVIRHARAHRDLAEQYGVVWELLEGAPRRAGFLQSRLWLKAQMTLLRGLLLAGDDDSLRKAEELITALPAGPLQESDQARLDNYRVWLNVRRARHAAAVAGGCLLIERYSSAFATQFAARAAADAVLADSGAYGNQAKAMLPILRARAAECAGHPGDLIWRDVGVLEHLVGRGQKAGTECFLRSLEISQGLPASPVNEWNRHVAEMHLSELCGRAIPDRSLPTAAERLSQQVRRMTERVGALHAYRIVSPY
jgi:hypothetical protein